VAYTERLRVAHVGWLWVVHTRQFQVAHTQ